MRAEGADEDIERTGADVVPQHDGDAHGDDHRSGGQQTDPGRPRQRPPTASDGQRIERQTRADEGRAASELSAHFKLVGAVKKHELSSIGTRLPHPARFRVSFGTPRHVGFVGTSWPQTRHEARWALFARIRGVGARPNVLLITLGSVSGGLLVVGWASACSDASSRSAWLRAGCGLLGTTARPRRAGPGGRRSTRACTSSTTGSSPTARRSIGGSTTSPSPGGVPATRRRCSATPTSPSTRATPPVPTILGSRSTRACSPASTRCSIFPSTTSRGSTGSPSSGTTRRPGGLTLLATEHERPEEHSLGAFLTDRAIDWIGDQDRAVVRPPQLPPPAPAVLGRRASGRTPTTRPTSASRSPADAGIEFHELVLLLARRRRARPTRPRSAACAPSTSG